MFISCKFTLLSRFIGINLVFYEKIKSNYERSIKLDYLEDYVEKYGMNLYGKISKNVWSHREGRRKKKIGIFYR